MKCLPVQMALSFENYHRGVFLWPINSCRETVAGRIISTRKQNGGVNELISIR